MYGKGYRSKFLPDFDNTDTHIRIRNGVTVKNNCIMIKNLSFAYLRSAEGCTRKDK
jgi:hypothetical protein